MVKQYSKFLGLFILNFSFMSVRWGSVSFVFIQGLSRWLVHFEAILRLIQVFLSYFLQTVKFIGIFFHGFHVLKNRVLMETGHFC